MKQTLKISLIYSQILFFILIPLWFELTHYLHPIVIGVVWFSITFLVLFAFCFVRKEQIQLSKYILQIITLLYTTGLIILLFFRPGGQSYGGIQPDSF